MWRGAREVTSMRVRSIIGSAAVLATIPIAMVVAGPAAAAAGPREVAAAPATLELADDRDMDARVTRVGEAYRTATDLLYTTGHRQWRTVIRHPGAAYVKVHFARLRVAAGDHVTVTDPAGREVHT